MTVVEMGTGTNSYTQTGACSTHGGVMAACRSRLTTAVCCPADKRHDLYGAGDIGTSVLYVYPSIFSGDITPGVINGVPGINRDALRVDICGALSLIFWTLTLLALLKYIAVVLRANDTGEGARGVLRLFGDAACHAVWHSRQVRRGSSARRSGSASLDLQ